MSLTHRNVLLASVAIVAGCSSSSSTEPDAATLRPGVVDSSQAYQGTPNAHETEFWSAVLDASDERRAAAVQQLVVDVEADPSNGYSAFLIGASAFMPPRAALEAAASGSPPPAFSPSPDAAPFLDQSLAHLTDPLYMGFAGMLLAPFLFATNDPRGPAVAAAALERNPVASLFGALIGDLSGGDAAAGLERMHALLDYCAGKPVARDGSAAAELVANMNAGALRHRECFSGFYAPHGSSGMLLITGDLLAINGQLEAAQRYYAAARTTSDYETWPLAPVVERRIAAGTTAPSVGETTGIAATCGTCHVQALR